VAISFAVSTLLLDREPAGVCDVWLQPAAMTSASAAIAVRMGYPE
jgi:hypothetical protein